MAARKRSADARTSTVMRRYGDGAGVLGTNGGPKRKLAETVAGEIERDIVRQGWPVGEVVGSESELLARYQVSRAVLREAVRLLEHHNVATMRRGPGGGLVVTEPDTSAVTEAVALFLEYKNVEPNAVFDTRAALELTAVQMATENIDEQGVESLRALLAREAGETPDVMPYHSHAWHIAIAELSGNAALALFVTILTRLTRERAVLPAVIDREASEVHVAHVKITEAIIAGDAALARHRMVRHLEAVASYLR